MVSLNNVSFSQLNNVSSLLKGFGSETGDMGSIFTLLSQIEGVTGNNTDNKADNAKKIEKVIAIALDLITKLLSLKKEKSEATTEVQKNAQDIEKADEQTEEIKEQLEEALISISSELGNYIDLVNENLNKTNENKELLENSLNRLKTIQAVIDEKKNALNNATRDEQKAILEEVKALANEIPGLVDNIACIQNSLKEASQNIATYFKEVEILKGNAVEVTTNASNEIVSVTAVVTEEVGDNASSVAKSGENTANAAAATEAAVAASTNPVTGVSVQKLYSVSADQTAAATTRIGGATSNLNSLVNAVGRLGETSGFLGSFVENINGSLINFDNAIGAWNNLLDPMIKSIGTIQQVNIVKKAAEDLTKIVDEDLKSITNKNDSKKLEESTIVNVNGDDNGNNVNSENNKLKILSFDTAKLNFFGV